MYKSIIALLTIALAVAVWGGFYKPASGQPDPQATDGNPVGFRLRPNMQLDQVIGSTTVAVQGSAACLTGNSCKFVAVYFKDTNATCSDASCYMPTKCPTQTCLYLTSSKSGLLLDSYYDDSKHGPAPIDANMMIVLTP